MSRRLGFFLILLWPLFWSWAAFAESAAASYTIAVVPQFKPQQIEQEWRPLLDRIGAETGISFKLIHYTSIPEFEKGFLAGEPDFAYMNPYHAVMAYHAQDYIPLVRDREPLSGILVVTEHSPIQRLQDLAGATIAFPAPNAYGASLLIRAALDQEHVQFNASYVKTHSNVYRQVALGFVQAGGGVFRTLADQPLEIRDGLRVLYETPKSAPHPIAVHPRVPVKVRAAFARAFLGLYDDEAGRAMLAGVRIPDPVTADYARDYRPLEQLHLDKYVSVD